MKACTRSEPLLSSAPPPSPSRSRSSRHLKSQSSSSALEPPQSLLQPSAPASASISGTGSRPRFECSGSLPEPARNQRGRFRRSCAGTRRARCSTDGRARPRARDRKRGAVGRRPRAQPRSGGAPLQLLWLARPRRHRVRRLSWLRLRPRVRASAAHGRGTVDRSEFASPRSRPPCRRAARRARFAPARSLHGSRASARRTRISTRS